MIRNLVISEELLYVEDGDGYRLVTVEPRDVMLRKAYREATRKHNRGRLRFEWLPDGEYCYSHGRMYERRARA